MGVPDTTLLTRWQAHRDADAFAEIVSRYSGMVYATCRRVLRNAADAEDVAQDCFVELMQSSRRLRASLGGWLHAAALHRSLDRLKAERRRRDREDAFAAAHPKVGETQPDDVLAHVDEAIGHLPNDLRTAVIQRFLEGRTNEAIAYDLGVAESTVRNRTENGVEQIRVFLSRRGVPVSTTALAALMAGRLSEAAPASLTASLGKLAISGGGPAAMAASTLGAAFQTLGSLAGVKSLVLLGAIAALSAAVVWSAAKWSSSAGEGRPAQSAARVAAAAEGPLASSEPAKVKGVVGAMSMEVGNAAARASTEPSGPAAGSANAADASGASAEGGVVTGRVYDADTGVGIEGVFPAALAPGWTRTVGKAEISDSAGRYRITGLPDGTVTIRPSGAGGYPEGAAGNGVSVTITGGGVVEGVDFALKKGVRLAGKVVSATGEPVAGARVRALTKEMVIPAEEVSGPDGSFEISLRSHSDTLVVQAGTAESTSPIEEGLSLPQGGLDNVVLRLTDPRASSISGVVVDAAGSPVAAAKVNVLPTQHTQVADGGGTECAADGTFRVEKLAAGTYSVIVTPPGATTFSTKMELARVELAKGESSAPLRLVFGDKGGLAISGRVVDAAGKPVAQAELRSIGPANEGAYSAADGSFSITGLTQGTYSVYARGQGLTRAIVAGVQAGAEDVEIVLNGTSSIQGRVLRADTGEPIPEFEVSFINGAYKQFGPGQLANGRKVQDAQGRFSLEQVYVGDVTVTAQAPGFGPSFVVVSLKEQEPIRDVELRLKPAEPFAGKVVTASGEPVANAFIFFGQQIGLFEVERKAVTRSNADGAFTISSFSPDIEAVGAYHPDYAPGVVRVARGNVIVLPQAGAIEGTLLDEGNPLPDTEVFAQYPDEPSLPWTFVKTGPDGTFRITGLAPGTVRMEASLNGFKQRTSCEAVVVSGRKTPAQLEFHRGGSTVEGRVTVHDAASGNALLVLHVTTGAAEDSFSLNPSPDGSFTFQGIPAGSARLDAQASAEAGSGRETFEFDLPDNQTVHQNIDFP